MESVGKTWHKGLKLARERNKRAQENEKLIHTVVHRMSSICRESYEDLYQIGYLGLLKAAERFDSTKGHAFSSFAIPYIQGEIQHYLRSQWQTIKIPRSSLELRAKVKRIKKNLYALGREAQELEIALRLDLTQQEWEVINNVSGSVTISLDELIHEPIYDIEESVSTNIEKYVNLLPLFQKTIILERFFMNKSVEAIAKKHSCSKQKIQSLINRGIAKIRLQILKEDYE